MLHRLSFACPRNVSQDGPPEWGAGRECVASTRRTTSLSMSTAKASAICCAIRGQPHRGLRRFMSTMASTSAWDGPWGPVRRRVGENSQRYWRVRRARWNSRIVDGLSTIAERITRAGRMNSAHTPARIRSDAQRFGARCRERFRMSSGCLTKTDSATTDRRPPGPISRARVAIRGTSRMIGSRIGTS